MVRNFLFHRVNPLRDKLWDPMDVSLFEKCIKYISDKYSTVLIEDLVSSPELTSDSSFATIMFDDGYKDNIEYAAPILEKYNCKASFYVVTDCIEKNIPTWTHILEHLFQFTTINDLKMDFEFLPEGMRVKSLNGYNSRIAYVSKLKPFLKTIAHEKRNQALEHIIKTFNDVTIPPFMMNWNDLKELRNAGHYIGSHTVSHCMLGTMTDRKEITNELINSGNAIRDNLGYYPVTISYPVGSYNSETIELSKEANYKIGLAVKQTVYDPAINNVFEIPRIELYNEPWWKTKLRISNALENIKSAIGYK